VNVFKITAFIDFFACKKEDCVKNKRILSKNYSKCHSTMQVRKAKEEKQKKESERREAKEEKRKKKSK
jgi:hypothetical protein